MEGQAGHRRPQPRPRTHAEGGGQTAADMAIGSGRTRGFQLLPPPSHKTFEPGSFCLVPHSAPLTIKDLPDCGVRPERPVSQGTC